MQHQKAGEFARAESLYRHLLQKVPTNFDVSFQLGSLLCQTGRLADGLPLLTTAAKASPANPQFQYYLGIALSTAGRLEESAAAHLRAVQLGPGMGVAHYALGNVLRRQRKWELAKASYEQSMKLGFVPPELYSYLAEIELGMRNYRQAVEFSRQELLRNPNHTASRLQLVEALFALDDTEAALAEYRKAAPGGSGVPAAAYPLMSAKEYSQAAGAEYLVVAPAKPFAVDAPRAIGRPFGASGGTARLEERYVARIRNGLLLAGHNVVIAGDSHAIYDNMRHPLGETVVPLRETFIQSRSREKSIARLFGCSNFTSQPGSPIHQSIKLDIWPLVCGNSASASNAKRVTGVCGRAFICRCGVTAKPLSRPRATQQRPTGDRASLTGDGCKVRRVVVDPIPHVFPLRVPSGYACDG